MDQQSQDDVPELQPEQVSPIDYGPPRLANNAKPKSQQPLLIAALVLIVAVVGAGVYWKFLRKKPAVQPTQSTTTKQETTPEAAATFAAKTKSYKSTSFSLSIDYPEDWKVDEAASDQLYITSPLVKLTDASNQEVKGKVMLSIKGKQQPQPEFDKGNALAARDSEKLSYTKPSQGQRAQTYASFLQYATSTAGLDGVYITGDTGYLKGQAIPKADFVPVQPIISLTFFKDCTGCTAADSRISIAASMWDNTQFATPLKAMLQSLTIN